VQDLIEQSFHLFSLMDGLIIHGILCVHFCFRFALKRRGEKRQKMGSEIKSVFGTKELIGIVI